MPRFQHDPNYLVFGQEGATAPTSRLSAVTKVAAAPIDEVAVSNFITKDVIAPNDVVTIPNCIVSPSLATTRGTIQPPLPLLLHVPVLAFSCYCNDDIELFPPSSMILDSCGVEKNKKKGLGKKQK
jgi:hypothetical protein